MIYLSYFIAGLVLILLQSLVINLFLPPGLIYDLLIPLVVYLSLVDANGKTLLLIMFLGFVMEGITGGAMGIYMLTYFWIFAGAQLAVHFFQKDSAVLMIVAVIMGLCLEYGIILAVTFLSGADMKMTADLTGKMFGRLMLAGLTSPLLLGAFQSLYGERLADRNIS